jgi:hypothetical protein
MNVADTYREVDARRFAAFEFFVLRSSFLVPAREASGGAPSTTRTCDLLVRSQTLYPTELWARVGCRAATEHHPETPILA